MGIVKRQGIKASILVYIGFVLGAINLLVFFPVFFSEEQLGLTRVLTSTTLTFAQLSLLGLPAVMLKFYPYYRSHAKNNDDLLFWGSLFAFVGFIIVSTISWYFYPDIVAYFAVKSPLLSEYFYLTFIGGFLLVVYSIFETYSRSHLRSVFPIFLREVGLRVYTSILILLYFLKIVDFQWFTIYLSLYFGIAVIAILIDLYTHIGIKYNYSTSSLTRRIKGKMFQYGSFIYGGGLFAIIADNIDSILIAGIAGLKSTGVFTIASYIVTILQVPQRTIASIATPILAKSWKEKDYENIKYLYVKTSLSQLIFGFTIFLLIWLNIDELFSFLPPAYAEGKYVVLVLCITRIIDLGTGINAEILITSNFWRFNFITHVLLVALSIPINYFLILKYGIIGSAFSNLIAFTAYNSTRFYFIYKKFNMQPLTINTLYVLLLAAVTYTCSVFLNVAENLYAHVIINVLIIGICFVIPIIYFNISEDFKTLYHQVIDRLKSLVKK